MQKSKMNAFPNEAMWRDAIYKLLKHIETCFTHTQTHQTHPHPPQRKTSKHIQAYPSYTICWHTRRIIQTLHS